MYFQPRILAVVAAVLTALHAGAETLAERSFSKLRDTPPASDVAFDFIVLGDTRSAEPIGLPEVFKQSIREFNTHRPAFVVDVGDLILGGAAEGLAPQWDEFLDVVSHCEAPFFPVAGNHDISDEATEKIYEDRIGPTRYAFTYGNSRFIMLNTEEVGAPARISDEQVAWLKKDLETTDAEHIFLFVHKPYFEWGYVEGEPWQESWANVAEAIKGHPVRVVFGSDVHLYRDCGIRDGVRYIITAGGGARLSAPYDEGGFFHYLLVRVRGEEVSWSVIKPGSTVPMDYVTKERVMEVRNARGQWVRTEPLEVPLGEGFDRQVAFFVENPLDTPIEGELRWQAPAGWHVEPATVTYSVPPGGSSRLLAQVKADGPEVVQFPVPHLQTTYPGVKHGDPVAVDKRMDLIPTATIIRAPEPVSIDGDLAEWDDAQRIPLRYAYDFSIDETWDLESECRMMWDENYIYLAIESRDNQFHQPYAGDIVWSADNVQLFINTDWEWGLTMTENGPEVFLHRGVDQSWETVNRDVKLNIGKHDEGRYMVYEAAFPKWMMTAPVETEGQTPQPFEPEAGKHFLLSVVVNDLDPDGPNKARHWAELTPGAGSGDRGFPMLKVLLGNK